ncbi:MAG: histidinol-phosphate transaminase [Treponemataceae bacterium]|nr:histidinol-phosphate transaminase [Treponemataceae bacterium]
MFAQRLQNLNPYKPGEQPKDREYIKLNANENPYPPTPKIKETLKNFDIQKLALYPDPDSHELKRAIAASLNKTGGVLVPSKEQPALDFEITEDMIFCGNGSDEVLSFVFYAFFDDNKPVVSPEFSYSFYPVYAGYYGITLAKVPLKPDFSLDTEAMLKIDSTGMIFANPNAPTGKALSLKEIEKMLETYPKDKVFVVDEAYADFSGFTVLPLLKKYKNLLVIRTFSKSMSFAGMRLGFAVGAPELAAALTTTKNSFNHFPADAFCQAAAITACQNIEWYAENCRKVMNTRDNFCTELVKSGWNVIPSSTNFVLVSKNGVSGKDVYEAIKKQGILVRFFDIDVIRNFVRITIGTDEQMQKLLEVMKNI